MGQIEQYLEQKPKLDHSVVGYLLRGDEVLLGERKTSKKKLGLGRLVGIGGGEEPGETPRMAFDREVFEEVVVTVLQAADMGQVVFIFPQNPEWSQAVKIFLSQEGEWDGNPTETSSIVPVWAKILALPLNRMWQDNAIWVPEVLKGHHVNGIFVLDPVGNILEQQFEVLPENS